MIEKELFEELSEMSSDIKEGKFYLHQTGRDNTGVTWYQISCHSDIIKWLREHPTTLWRGVPRQSHRFMLHEQLYSMLVLTWK